MALVSKQTQTVAEEQPQGRMVKHPQTLSRELPDCTGTTLQVELVPA